MHEQLAAVPTLQAYAAHAELDRDTMDAMLDEAERTARDLIAPLNAPGDKQGCRLDADGNVRTPDGYKEAYKAFVDGGWIALGAPAEFGGLGMPHVMEAALGEMVTGACPAFS
ncbi:MAG: acyl-CoA dehydrogenase, partial [bacterium]